MPKPRKSLFADPYIEIVHRLIERRKALGVTQWDLAKAYGEDQSFISRIERCQRRLDVYEFTVMCRILGVEPGEFLRPVWESTEVKMLPDISNREIG
ncbi:multiprotein-bridging factor 1 family protein [Azospirillum doebereinerae]|uniref:helix-turn-helix domain-containing protein n=1 Tax=Azospirillum doebereinerae TaxID=92933 RepID=UPI001EE5A0D8|nr:helix-turn-helix transcriptional regulator [Azospirillum doebereinerae]MCG5244110.1 helix-turn-helix transcriptional regulator [Azospirillum doebereinerae]